MRRWIVAALLLAGAVQTYQMATGQDEEIDPGSVEAGTNVSAPAFANGSSAPETLVFGDCREHFAFFSVPAEAYEDRLPEGFELDPFVEDPAGETATLVVYGQACGPDDASQVSRVTVYLPVDPPDAWEHPDEEAGHDLVLSTVTTSERVRRVTAAWGFSDVAAAGQVAMEETRTPAAHTGTLQASAGDASLELETTVEGQASELDGGLSRQFALGSDGTVTGARDLNWTSFQWLDGRARVSGSTAAGMPSDRPVPPGIGGHAWGFEQTQTYVDLPEHDSASEEDPEIVEDRPQRLRVPG